MLRALSVRALSVRARVVLASSMVFAIFLVGIGYALMQASLWVQGDSAAERARHTVSVMGEQLRTDRPEEVVPPGTPPSPERVEQVWSPEGFVLATSNRAFPERIPFLVGKEAAVGVVSTVRTDEFPGVGHGYVVGAVLPVRLDDGRILTAVAVESASLPPAAERQFLLLALGGSVAAITMLALLSLAAVRAALRPVERMREQVDRITSSNDGAQVSVPRHDDELSRLAVTINDLLRRLHTAEAQRAAFVSNAGHELRSPLATISLSMEQMLTDPEPARRATIAARAEHEVQRLRNLVEDLLALAAVDEGRPLARSEDVDLDDVVLGEVGVARAKGATVRIDLAPARLEGNQDQIQRVVRNLLDNARRHARSEIRVSVRANHRLAVLRVDNDGDPVPEVDRERIFERFVRLDDARDRDRGGTGLGLPIVASLVAVHGGRVKTTTAPDGWCRFEVRLPVERPGGAPEPGSELGAPPTGGEGRWNG